MIFQDDETRDAWEELQRSRMERALADSVRAHLPILEKRHVLDLFCGHGRVTAELLELGALVTAIDDLDEAIAETRRRAPDAAVVQADPHELPLQLRRGRFQVVLLAEALWRVRDLGALLGGAVSALKRGGMLVIADEHPAAACVDPVDLRWREDYFAIRPTLGELVTAIVATPLALTGIHELPSSRSRLDQRIPGELLVIATKP